MRTKLWLAAGWLFVCAPFSVAQYTPPGGGGGGGSPSGPAGGDLSGTYPDPTVAKVNGNTPGGTCTNQFARVIDSSGRPTCASVANADLAGSIANNKLSNSSTTVAGQVCTLGSSCSVASTNLSDTAQLVRTTDTGSVTNAMLAGSIANAKLTNSSVTVNSTTCTLGSSCSPSAAPSGSAGGDLSSTYPNPTVAKVNGNTPGGTCTNQFARSIDSSGRPTCASVANADLTNSSVTVNGTTCTLGSSCTPASGSLVLLEQHTASSSASLNFTTGITSTYDQYQIEVVNVFPATATASLRLRMSTNGGSSYDSGTNYQWATLRICSTATASTGGASDTSLLLGGSGGDSLSTSTQSGSYGTVKLFSPLNGAFRPSINADIGYSSSGCNGEVRDIVTGQYLSTTAVNAFQILFSSGNIASGTVRLYGIAK